MGSRVSPEQTPTGPLYRLSLVAGAAGTGLVVASAALELGAAHWGLAAIVLPLLIANTVLARLAYPQLLLRTASALLLLLVAIALGGLVAWSDRASWATGLHVAAAGAALAAALVAAVGGFRGAPAPFGAWRDYVTLTKPRIMVLLLLTAAGGMFVGAGGVPSAGLLAATLGGLALACGGASALNHVLDRDIDVHMRRTDRRPVAAGRVTPERALEFGVALSALSFVVLASFVNVLAALLAVAGNLFYVVVYTRYLKRSTPQNIVIGGAAGAVPPLVGWAAATGNLTLPALFLFLIVFYWTPPHFWALALLIRRDYEAARIPMLPVVKGEAETARSIVRYTVVLIAISMLPVIWKTVGWLYLGAAIGLGAAFLILALSLRRETTPARARRLFSFSLAYLALLFVAMAVDPLVL
jgi:protoheme IX farnesyltransferase